MYPQTQQVGELAPTWTNENQFIKCKFETRQREQREGTSRKLNNKGPSMGCRNLKSKIQ